MEKQTNIENVSSKITVSIIYIYIVMLGDKLYLRSVETGDYEGIIKLSIHPYIYITLDTSWNQIENTAIVNK